MVNQCIRNTHSRLSRFESGFESQSCNPPPFWPSNLNVWIQVQMEYEGALLLPPSPASPFGRLSMNWTWCCVQIWLDLWRKGFFLFRQGWFQIYGFLADASFEPATRFNITNMNEIDHIRSPIVFECLNVRGWERASVGARADRLPTHPQHQHVRTKINWCAFFFFAYDKEASI